MHAAVPSGSEGDHKMAQSSDGRVEKMLELVITKKLKGTCRQMEAIYNPDRARFWFTPIHNSQFVI